MRKLRKLLKTPAHFFRDYLNRRYPESLNQHHITRAEEIASIRHSDHEENLIPNSLEIDAVITWVDHTDQEWVDKLNQSRPACLTHHPRTSLDQARFENHNELFYCVKSISLFMPWIRKIFIVTEGHKPSVPLEDPRIVYLDHKQIIPQEYLPTFNSHVIEAHLQNIPHLSETFIYFNDDVFVGRPVSKNHFFQPNSIASLFCTSKQLTPADESTAYTPTQYAIHNSSHILQSRFSAPPLTHLIHTYFPLRKTVLQEICDQLRNEIHGFAKNKFRGKNDLNIATFLAPWLAFHQGLAVPKIDICRYFNIRSPNAIRHYADLLLSKQQNRQPHSFCANDFSTKDTNLIPNPGGKLEEMLKRYFC